MNTTINTIGTTKLVYVRGKIFDVDFDFLVDSGATDCFVPASLVKINGWNVTETAQCDVKLPSG